MGGESPRPSRHSYPSPIPHLQTQTSTYHQKMQQQDSSSHPHLQPLEGACCKEQACVLLLAPQIPSLQQILLVETWRTSKERRRRRRRIKFFADNSNNIK